MIITTPHPEHHRLETLSLEPFAETERHTHPVDMTLVVLDGWIRVWLNGRWHWLSKNDNLLIPAAATHMFAVGARRTTIELINQIPIMAHQEQVPVGVTASNV